MENVATTKKRNSEQVPGVGDILKNDALPADFLSRRSALDIERAVCEEENTLP